METLIKIDRLIQPTLEYVVVVQFPLLNMNKIKRIEKQFLCMHGRKGNLTRSLLTYLELPSYVCASVMLWCKKVTATPQWSL